MRQSLITDPVGPGFGGFIQDGAKDSLHSNSVRLD
jgi:hypothetical protein